MRAFTLDPARVFSPGQELSLTKFDDIEPKQLQGHVDQMFPEGVSRHGDFYFLSGHTSAKEMSPNIELLFEYVRRTSFPARPSRFQSWFGCETIEGIFQFASAYRATIGGLVWEVDAADVFRADMSLLHLNGTPLQTSFAANSYWTGRGSTNPFWELLLVPPIKIIRVAADVVPAPVTAPLAAAAAAGSGASGTP